MKNRNTLPLLMLLSVLTLTISCKKNRELKLSGIYECSVEYRYWDMTPKISDTNYVQDLEIKQEGSILFILGEAVPADSVKSGREFTKGYGQNYFAVSFKNRQVHIQRRSGGLGGGVTWIYIGNKRE